MLKLRLLASACSLFACLSLLPAGAQTGASAMEDLPAAAAGSFLSGRVAVAQNDLAQIARNYDNLLPVASDNLVFRELAMQGHLLSGNFERAAELAAQSQAREVDSQIAQVILQADEFLRGAYSAVIDAAQDGRRTGPLTDAMSVAWANLGKGSMSDALESFDTAISEQPDLAPFIVYHKALALALVGDLERAADLLTGQVDGPVSLTRRGVLAHLAILSQLGRMDEALLLAGEMFGQNPEADVAHIQQELEEGRSIPFTTVTSARDGMAEAYLLVATALIGDQDDWLPIIYGRLALALRPDHPDAILLVGQLLEQINQLDLAMQIYDTMPKDSPSYMNAFLGKSNARFLAGERDAAITQLQDYVAEQPPSVIVYSTLGDLLRREERFDEAVAAYSSAIDLIDVLEERHWVLLYTLAISLERTGDWDRAEPEFRRVLEFVPDEPQVLNYLGYSLLEQQQNLDEALEMIERAVEGEPDSGYIVDSLGWALFRLGRYDEAVAVMERAVELLPQDPILNDHLGDVYWAVGRQREARFQWRRAISFAPHPDLDLERLRRKLDVGLDVVLEEEGAAPLEAVVE